MSANLLDTINTGLGRRTSQAPQRHDFSKIKTAVPIPNLIEIQRESYNRFLQMDMLPEERQSTGLQAVFKSVFPISDFRETATLDFVEYQIGNWQCKCGNLEGLKYLRSACKNCKASIKVDPLRPGQTLCHVCGTFNAVRPELCPNCGEPVGLKHKHDQQECQERGMSYSVPLKVKIRLTVYDKDPDTNVKSIRDIKEEEVFFGEIPLMTDNGTFIINGTERVIVSQLHRSPGVFFKRGAVYIAKIIPYRGSWVEFEYDQKNLLYVRVGKRKFLATIFLRALGIWLNSTFTSKSFGSDGQLEEAVKSSTFSDEDLLRAFYVVDEVRIEDGRFMVQVPDAGATHLVGMKVDFEIKGRGPDPIVRKGKEITKTSLAGLRKANIGEVEIEPAQFEGAYAVADVVNTETGEVILEANNEITPAKLQEIIQTGVQNFSVFFPESDDVGVVIAQTLKKDTVTKPVDALLEIYRKMRPGDPPTVQTAYRLLEGMFFDPRKFDFSRVGRLKFNIKMGKPEMLRMEDPLLAAGDFFEVVSYVLKMRKNPVDEQKKPIYQADDIDHLGNRRVRAVGELLENQFRIGLERMERAIKEKMSIHQEMQTTMPRDLINAKPVTAAVREFFGSSQLSQFMDQTNPLSEITHKRRLSALGPGGLTRERAGFEVRDVHPTHYGRICPIETPEGPNIGLINSLATFARVNKYGFVETPYRKVKDGRVTDEVVYLSAMEEGRYHVAQANVALDNRGRFTDDLVVCRHAGDVVMITPDKVDYMDVSPKQLVSVVAALIQFLENDDANRALMGSNMQRQAVPLVRAEAPFVGTGMEGVVARDSGASIAARRTGIVDQVDATRIVVRATEEADPAKPGVDIYRLMKFQRSNQNTCINQRPLVKMGDLVTKGDIIADGPSTELGELALGRNVLVAFMPWNGYNFEDSILLSERIVKDDVFSSIHIEEFEVMARDTKLGPEEITRDIPNVSEEALKNLDEAGIVYIGAEVRAGDILCGKITPKGESPMTPEEKLLRAIFGEKASDVRDTSLRVPPGVQGTVVEVRVFNRHGVEKDERALAIEREEIERLAKDRDDEQAILDRNVFGRLADMLEGRQGIAGPKGFKKDSKITRAVLDEYPRAQWWQFASPNDKLMAEIEAIRKQYDESKKGLEQRFLDKVEKLQRGDELPPGVMKMVKVFVAVKRKIQPGDKMAGRHGNKGVVSKIVPAEDMPFLSDGTPVDVVLNPLGVPSRMNVGQILETHLGWACAGLGKRIGQAVDLYNSKHDTKPLKEILRKVYGDDETIKSLGEKDLVELGGNLRHGVPIATPVFDGAKEADIEHMLDLAGLDHSGQMKLYDGRTGEAFDRKVTVGYIYMLKLHHLVDDKIHARSIGPYSLVTQQPLGGKAQFGGQRFGEMEVWALEAYGAAYTLQEMLTVKSDDVAGRTKVYEAIVRGDDTFEAGIPESFNVLVKEMRSLSLNVDLHNSKQGRGGPGGESAEAAE